MSNNISILTLAMLLCLLGGCKHNGAYTINGAVSMPGFDGSMVYLTDVNTMEPIDSAVVADSKFTFQGTVEQPTIGAIQAASVSGDVRCTSYIVLEEGTIYIDIVTDSLSGTPLNDYYYSHYTADTAIIRLRALQNSIIDQFYSNSDNQDLAASLMAEYGKVDSSLTARTNAVLTGIYQENSDNVLGAYALANLADAGVITFDSLDNIMAHANPIVAQFSPLVKIYERLENVAKTSEGKPFVDLNGIDFATGKATKLSKMIQPGQITLIDFWASWCSPCRGEIKENLIRLYDKYASQGLNIIGIDVWDKPDDHKAAVEGLGIKYPQLIDDEGTATDTYGVDGVPTILLIDKNGTIVKRGIRGDEIEKAIIEYLAK
ncbi:MAG: AhpC/TSA family protein [Bacteroidales bacterium]|nr:AhpC/TSA family protein [Bacteroidales bacterium]